MNRIAKTIIIALTGAAAFAGTALADTTNATDASKTSATPPAVTTGSINTEPTYEQRVEECMAIWDKGTHMTKVQWRRSCRTTLQSLTTE